MLSLKQTVVVEGKYDKIKLSAFISSPIIVTDGFALFKDKERLALLRKAAETTGLLVLTDSDAAGLSIRNYIRGAVPKGEVLHAFIPDVIGKEKRKKKPSAEGKLGVEGLPVALLQSILQQAGANVEKSVDTPAITHAHLYTWGLSGKEDSKQKRLALQQKLGLPARMNTNLLLQTLNRLYSLEEIEKTISQ